MIILPSIVVINSYNITYILVSKGAKDVVVSAWIANKTTFEECDVENGRIEVDKLEDEYLECQIIVEF